MAVTFSQQLTHLFLFASLSYSSLISIQTLINNEQLHNLIYSLTLLALKRTLTCVKASYISPYPIKYDFSLPVSNAYRQFSKAVDDNTSSDATFHLISIDASFLINLAMFLVSIAFFCSFLYISFISLVWIGRSPSNTVLLVDDNYRLLKEKGIVEKSKPSLIMPDALKR
ncbi:MAG: hypothetical protein L3J89_02755 [Gammaproteobacteria bacterium]|nr:hypothetical protein [Gammaproteobacteria bacterium]